ncbi:glycosyl hydrolase [Mucilaginibacter limnophilus]|uniref:Glycosyl hydrolase n=1 Tax=Mucilaginibacter limnophilus TaxID=1932778 RepID=A0A3S2Y3B4_9SPHI|nr:glycoside hydrolase family 3 N-terminal domain-containing protein [Mucilaginibacter limnophilus]RVU00977.1 glycosyl hydrolase [Mucilaginibacter limnophilus]
MKFKKILLCISLLTVTLVAKSQQQPLYKDGGKNIDERINDLVHRLTLEEKIGLLGYQSKAVPRLGIPAYNWWNEALHGVARAGEATVFPQAIGMAASFDDDLLYQVAATISTEARAKFNIAVAKGDHLQYMGLTFWSPNINIFRDPRWGRGQETYGEDPYLTGRMGSAFVKGMQGDDPLHLKTSACAKHFAVHSGPEAGRGAFNSVIDEKDLRETYLPAFHQLVNSGVESVMGAYNRVNGEPSNISNTLLGILRNEWGFKGHLVTDCGALDDIWQNHKVLKSRVEVAAAAIKAGVNLDCSTLLQSEVIEAVKQNLLTEKEIDNSLKKLLATQFKLGFYDDNLNSAYASYNADSVRSAYHIELARKMAAESMVLLKNDNNVLPINKDKVKNIFVTGPNAFNADVLLGNYRGISPEMVTFTEGITKAAGPGISVIYEIGSDLIDSTRFGGIANANASDVTFVFIGLSPMMEGEDGDAFLSNNGADRANLGFPAVNIALLKKIRASTKKPIVAVVTAGSDIDIAQINQYADAILLAWYPGEQGGNALADIAFGRISPSGHLPVTFYNKLQDLPKYSDYNMKGRTYRYFTGPVQYPFGYGLSYTTFNYKWASKPQKSYKKGQHLSFNVDVENTGTMDADEVLQTYISFPDKTRMPIKELKQFKRVKVEKGASHQVAIDISVDDLAKWDLATQKWILYKGDYKVYVGSSSADVKLSSIFKVL